MTQRAVAVLVAMLAIAAGCSGADRVIVGAGTTIVDSGLVSELEQRYGGDISVVGGPTAELLELAARGSLDVAIVHDVARELEYVAANPSTVRRFVFSSRFLIVGPPDLIGEVPATSATAAFAYLAVNEVPFVTRADRSGTHQRELAIWASSGLEPAGDWYIATGQGMGLSLQVADQRDAFTLVEEGAFLAATATVDLQPLPLPAQEPLTNPYHALLVEEAGRDFFDWLTSAAGRDAVAAANQAVFGATVYATSAEAAQQQPGG